MKAIETSTKDKELDLGFMLVFEAARLARDSEVRRLLGQALLHLGNAADGEWQEDE